MTLWYMVGFCKIPVLYNVGSGVCAIVSQTILSHMLEDSSRAHSGDISKANSAVTADAENPFITFKLPFLTRACFLPVEILYSAVFLCHGFQYVWTGDWQCCSVQYWIYLIPPGWVFWDTQWIHDQTEISYRVQNWSHIEIILCTLRGNGI